MDEIEYLGATSTILSYNLFTYCEGNPISLKDPNGTDAIYVVDYKFKRGLPVVGHAILYYQDEQGNWRKTEFRKIDNFKAGVVDEPLEGDTKRVLETLKKDNKYQYTYLYGDYFKAKEYFDTYKSLYSYNYDLTQNNCLHYINNVLNYVYYGNDIIRYKYANSIIPRFYKPLTYSEVDNFMPQNPVLQVHTLLKNMTRIGIKNLKPHFI